MATPQVIVCQAAHGRAYLLLKKEEFIERLLD